MFLLFYFHLPWQCSVLYPNSHFLDFTIGKYNLQTEGSHILAKYVLHIYQFSFIERKVRLLFVKVGIRNVRYAVMIAWYFCWYLQCISWCLPLTFSCVQQHRRLCVGVGQLSSQTGQLVFQWTSQNVFVFGWGLRQVW